MKLFTYLRDTILPYETRRRRFVSHLYYSLRTKPSIQERDQKYNMILDLDSINSLSLMIQRIKKGSIILEFGPAHGRMTKYMKEVLGCKIYAVELDKQAAEDVKVYCEKVLIGDIERYDWLEIYKDLRFDYIIFADVLEHLYWPEKVLAKAKQLLKDHGSLLISIPNIAHNSILIDLFNDQFTYHPTGLLDNTHIRFYTQKSFKSILKKLKFKIVYEGASYCAPKNTEFMTDYSSVPDAFAQQLRQRETGEIYQYIYELK